MSEKEGCLPRLFRPNESTKPSTVYPYKAKASILTTVELKFYLVLQQIVGTNYVICPKVRIADIVSITDKENYMRYFGKVSQKHIDFLLCNPQTLRPLFGIELDDKSHLKRQKRDKFVNELFQAIDVPLLRMPALSNYDIEITKTTLQKRLKEAKAHNQSS